ncbi:MAG: hypothetical protein ACLFTK_00795 [Anaerolineales bacterium]
MTTSKPTTTTEPTVEPQADWRAAWDAPLQPGACESCDILFLIPDNAERLLCPNCLAETLVPASEGAIERMNIHAPEAVLPFSATDETVANALTTFVREIPMKPFDLSLENLRVRAQRVYVPMWWLDVDVNALWQAEAGYPYEVISHREVYDAGWKTQQVTETRLRWEPRVGQLQRRYTNIPAPAVDAEQTIRQQVGDFQMSAVQAYAPDMLRAGALVRVPERPPDDAWDTAQKRIKQRALQDIQVATGAESLREFRWTPNYDKHQWTYLLMPVYVTYYRNVDRQRHWVIIHGQTGQVTGERRANIAQARLFSGGIFAIAAVLMVVSIILFLLGLSLVSTLLFLFGVLVALAAPVPFFRAWNFNRRQGDAQERPPTRLLS